MDEAVRIEVTGKIDGKIARSLRDIAKAAIEADTNLDLLRQAIQGFNAGSAIRAASQDTRALRTEMRQATASQRQLSSAVNAGAASFVKAAGGADRYGNSLRGASAAGAGLLASTNTLRGAVTGLVGLFGGIFAIQQYAQAQDALTSIQNKIRSLTGDLERQRNIQTELFNLANRTRSGVEATTDGFVRFSKAMQDASDQEVIRFVETLNKALISAGRSTAEVNSVVIQLGQALTSGRLMGDEFRSLSENLPREALEAIAAQLGVGVDKLKELSTQGMITTEVLRNAFAGMADFIDEQFARTIPTIGQAITVLNNKFIAFTESSSAGAQLLAQSILWIGDNLNIIIPLIASFAAAWAAVQLAKIILEFTSLVRTVFVAVAAFTAANFVTLAWLGAIVLITAAVLALAYMVAKLTGTAEQFEEMMKHTVEQVQEWAAGMLGFKDTAELASAAQEKFSGVMGQSTSATNTAMDAINALTEATNDNEREVKEWSDSTVKAVNAVASSYLDLTSAQRDALALGAQAHYEQLQASGGSSGSFQAVGRPTDANSITNLERFNTGGSFMVGGRGGVDRNLVSFAASRGERVTVETPAQQRRRNRNGDNETVQVGGPTFIFNVQANDVDSFRLSKGQMANDVYGAMG